MPVYPLTLPATYRDQGFFNVTVEFDGYVRPDKGPVELLLVARGTEQRVEARVNRSAQNNGTARVMGGPDLRRWFQEHYRVGERVDVDIRSPECIRIIAPAG
jgi:hypothetical protein